MWQFIVSGYIPGTNLQITFESLVLLSLVILSIVLMILLIRDAITETEQITDTIQNLDEIAI